MNKMTQPKPDDQNPPLFTDKNEDRHKNFLIRMSGAEREFLEAEAKKLGVATTNLVRSCIRKVLIEDPASEKQD